MEFFRETFALTLVEQTHGKHTCFAADLFSPRPPFEEIQSFKELGQDLQQSFQKLMDRNACPIKWLALFVDQEGAMLLATTKAQAQMNNTRSALSKVLGPLPKEQQQAVADSLRPLDELDNERITSWQTVDSLRPKVRPRHNVPLTLDDITEQARNHGRPMTLSEFMENDWSDEEEVSLPTTLVLYGSATVDVDQALATQGGPSYAAWAAWVARAQTFATVVIAATGPAPPLMYLHCHREPRRHLLLVQRLRKEELRGMVETVRLAVRMAKEGSVPGPGGRRTSEFIKRCAAAVAAVSPRAETDLTKLPREEQQSVRRALGDEKEPYQGCLSEGCLDKETVWVEMVFSGYPEPDGIESKISRCARCHKLKSYGHSFNSLNDMLAPTLKRERGMCARIVDDMLAQRPRLN